MATAGSWSRLSVAIDSEIISVLSKLGYPNMTPCQASGVPPILQHQDVAIDAETGSGKTLSFLVPIAHLLLYNPSTRCRRPSPSVRALVIVPTRELAAQVHTAATALFSELPGDIVPVPLIGGGSAKHGAGPSPEHVADTRLMIATPGRLNAAMNASAVNCRSLEVLIMDEADRLLDMGFSVALTSILTRLPKQRRTGLYSATQTEQVDELARAGLRNPVRVTVRVRTRKRTDSESAAKDVAPAVSSLRRAIPTTLSCYFTVLRHEYKLHHFVRLLASYPTKKFIVYLLTCSSVDYFARLPLQKLLKSASEAHPGSQMPTDGSAGSDDRLVVALHGKMSQSKRTRALEKFARSANAVLICTDVAARGLDIPDVDWVVQFDPPQDPDAYVHRVGRTARLGREGDSLIYLAPHEDAYPDFLRVRRCPVEAFRWPDDRPQLNEEGRLKVSEAGNEAQDVKERNCKGDDCSPEQDCSASDADKVVSAGEERGSCVSPALRDRVAAVQREMILSDRAVLDVAEKAFLSYLRAYKEHRCTYLLPFNALDLGSVARSFSLVRLPRFQEFKRYRAKMDFEPDKSIRVRDIKYKDKARERQRQADIKDAVENRKERRDALRAKSKKKPKKRKRHSAAPIVATTGNEEGDGKDDEADMDELNEEARMIKKLRRGKLSRQDFDRQTGYESDSSEHSVSDEHQN